jgi:hypothetical protein
MIEEGNFVIRREYMKLTDAAPAVTGDWVKVDADNGIVEVTKR